MRKYHLFKDGQNKDRNGKDLMKAGEVKGWKRLHRITIQKHLNDLGVTMMVPILTQPDIVECEVSGPWEALLRKWKVEFQQSYLKSKKMMLLKICRNLENPVIQNWKRSIFIPVPKRGITRMFKPLVQLLHSSLISVRLCSKSSSQAESIMQNQELLMFQAGFQKSRKSQRSICQHFLDLKKAKRIPENIYLCFIDFAKALTVCIITNCRKLLNRWEYQTILHLLRNLYDV